MTFRILSPFSTLVTAPYSRELPSNEDWQMPAKDVVAPKTESSSGDGDKKVKPNIKYPPYVYAYGAIPKLFEEIRKASVPPKFTQDYMETVLGLKSSSHRALIPLLKKLGFIDAANVPTDSYRAYRELGESERVMAQQIRNAYADVYRANEYAHNLTKDQLASKLRTITGAAEDDANITAVVGTFLELRKLADFEAVTRASSTEVPRSREEVATSISKPSVRSAGFGLSYTINLNLPATTEIEVFNAIFRSLKENMLSE